MNLNYYNCSRFLDKYPLIILINTVVNKSLCLSLLYLFVLRSIIFANYIARDTKRLGATIEVEHSHVRYIFRRFKDTVVYHSFLSDMSY